jgi:hypothetical protein
MKKIAIALNAVLVGIIVMQACNPKNKSQISICPPDSCRHYKPYNNVELPGVVKADVVQMLSQAYYHDAGKAFITGSEFHPLDPHNTARAASSRDALSMIFDLEKVKNLIWKMEQAVCTSGCDTSLKLGIRFYYIKYAMDSLAKLPYEMQQIVRANPNKHALVMVPVFKRTQDTEWYDFDYTAVINGCKFLPVGRLGTDDVFFGIGITGSGDNHGGVGPPPEPGTYPTNQPAQQ